MRLWKKIKKQLRECRTEDSTLRRQQSGPGHRHQQHVSSCLTSSPNPDSLRSEVMDLTLWPPAERSWVWGMIWDLFSRRPVSCSIMSHYPRVVCVRMPGWQISTLFYLHLCSPTINTHNSRHYPFEHVSCDMGEGKCNLGLILKK